MPKKYDCSKEEDYFHEKERMCSAFPNCYGCPRDEDELLTCDGLELLHTQKAIDIVQKWSDENPEKTNLDAPCEGLEEEK